MIMGGIIGAMILGGIAITVYHDKTYFVAPVIGLAMVGAAIGIAIGMLASSSEPEQCPEGQVKVIPNQNSAGANGCVPYEMLPKIAEKSDS